MDWYNNTYPHEDHYQEKKAMQPYLSLNSIVNESEPITFIPLLVHVVCAEASDAVNFRVMLLDKPPFISLYLGRMHCKFAIWQGSLCLSRTTCRFSRRVSVYAPVTCRYGRWQLPPHYRFRCWSLRHKSCACLSIKIRTFGGILLFIILCFSGRSHSLHHLDLIS